MAKQTKTEFKRWDQYVEEAAIEPYQIPVSDEETIYIEAPSGAGLIQFARALRTGDEEAMMIVLCGEQWGRMMELLGTGGHKAMNNLILDMMVHFDLAEEVTLIGPSGGKRIEKDPRKIQILLKQGYRPEGEAGSRI